MYKPYGAAKVLKATLSILLLALMAPEVGAQRFVRVANTIDDLVRLNINDPHTNVFVADPTRGGMFTLADRSTTNRGTALASTNALKQWNRQFVGPLNIKWFGANGTDQLSDQTAWDDVYAAAVAANGGTILFPSPGSYLLNILITNDNIRLLGELAEVNQNTTNGIVPYNTSLPAVQVGNDATRLDGIKIEDLSIFGNRGATNAPSALYFPGGTFKATVRDCQFILGADTVYIKAGVTNASTLISFNNCALWEGTNSTIRAVDIRSANPESFATGIYFTDTYLNGKNDGGRTIRVDQLRNLNLVNVYKDSFANFSIELKNGGSISGYNTDLENEIGAGVNLIDIVSTTENFTDFDPSRYISGNLRVQGTIRWTGTNVITTNSLPTDDGGGGLTFLASRSLLRKPRLIGPFSIATVADPFTREYEWDMSTAGGDLWQYRKNFEDFTLAYQSTNTTFKWSRGDVPMRVFFDFPSITTQFGLFEFFRSTASSGVEALRIYKGDGSANIQHDLTTANTYFNYQTGNFGIGTNNPVQKLHVEGTIQTEGHLLFGTDNLRDIGASGATRPRNVYVGTKVFSPSARLSALPVHANNAAAVAGGLVVGDLYRTGADPDTICVVH